jgi:hypothetical protein
LSQPWGQVRDRVSRIWRSKNVRADTHKKGFANISEQEFIGVGVSARATEAAFLFLRGYVNCVRSSIIQKINRVSLAQTTKSSKTKRQAIFANQGQTIIRIFAFYRKKKTNRKNIINFMIFLYYYVFSENFYVS